jgi:hypothetical protein
LAIVRCKIQGYVRFTFAKEVDVEVDNDGIKEHDDDDKKVEFNRKDLFNDCERIKNVDVLNDRFANVKKSCNCDCGDCVFLNE